MPRKPMRPCAYPGCPELVRSGYCDAHKRTQPDYHKPEHQRMYGTARWRHLRKAQLAREPWCKDCLEQGVYTAATDVDHITPHRGSERLFYDAENLQSLCRSCHSRKTAEEVFGKGGGGMKMFSTGERTAGGAIRTKKIPNVGNPVNCEDRCQPENR